MHFKNAVAHEQITYWSVFVSLTSRPSLLKCYYVVEL